MGNKAKGGILDLDSFINEVSLLNKEAMKACKQRLDSIAKPLNSLGKLEDTLIQIAGITGSAQISLKKKALVIMCADNGVVEEGISQTGQEVTAIVAENFLKKETTASIMCHQMGADIFPIDIGIARDTNIIQRKISYGTKNIAKGPAMTEEEAIKALEVGISVVKELKEQGYELIATGEMGIGNTTTSSALASVLLECPVEMVTGRGAGLSSEGVLRKIKVIKRAIEINKCRKEEPLHLLAGVGGLDIAGLAGVFMGGGIYHVPIVIDGMISSVAALLATRLCKNLSSYMIPSHLSKEPAGAMLLKALEKSPFLTCDMSLGEGTGAISIFPLLNMAAAVYEEMSTFKENHIEAYKELK
jgi:nicotinate-nucleotide--dimethylbenzimidazole phosphoribosyltransferase